jgi:YndJ-like protein/GLTT repeat (6 copies)
MVPGSLFGSIAVGLAVADDPWWALPALPAHLLVLFAVMVLVPLSTRLPALDVRDNERRLLQRASLGPAISLFVPTGAWAGTFAAMWVGACAFVFTAAALRFWADRLWSVEQVLGVVSLGWLPVAGLWLVASRSGVTPFGFHEPIVLLTSAHFHVAGHATTAITATVWAVIPASRRRWRRVAASAAACTTVGPLFVASGWQFDDGRLNLIGTTLLTAGLVMLVPCVFVATRAHQAADENNRRWAVAARLGSVMPFAPLVLALNYSLGRLIDIPAPSIEFMVRTHGAINAVGFAGLSLLAWSHLTAAASAVEARQPEINPIRHDHVVTNGVATNGVATNGVATNGVVATSVDPISKELHHVATA